MGQRSRSRASQLRLVRLVHRPRWQRLVAARDHDREPDRPALRRANGTAVIRPGDAVEIDRTVTKDGVVSIAGSSHLNGFAWAGRRVTLRLDGHPMPSA